MQDGKGSTDAVNSAFLLDGDQFLNILGNETRFYLAFSKRTVIDTLEQERDIVWWSHDLVSLEVIAEVIQCLIAITTPHTKLADHGVIEDADFIATSHSTLHSTRASHWWGGQMH